MADIEIIDTPVEETVHTYKPLIDALVAAGEGKSARVKVAFADLGKTKRQVREAANAQDFTAKLGKSSVLDADEDGNVVLVYTLGEKQTRPGRPAADAAPEKSKK